MKTGISSACLYPMLLEDAIENLLGIPYIEIFINTHSELKENYLKNLRKRLDEYGTECVSLHPFTCVIEPLMLFSKYERRISDFLEYHKLYFNAMNIIGAKIFILHGNKSIIPVANELYFERFLKLYELGKEFGITVAQENIVRCQSSSLQFLVDMQTALKDKANFVFDIKQCVRSGENVLEMAETLKDNIVHVHISDHGEKGDCLLIGQGNLDCKKLFSILNNNVIYMLELYRSNFNTVEDLLDNVKLINNM
ncbi:AP endonuclease [Clostridia bacterium]|nr:AP endonuclease [Clostridia bacterium]